MRRLRVLMGLAQRVGWTGSGVVVREMLRHGAGAEIEYGLVHADDGHVELPGTPAYTRTVRFAPLDGGLPFPIAGMSNVMPYPSTRFADLTPAQVESYLSAWRDAWTEAIAEFRPDVVHAHHLWLLFVAAAQVVRNIPLFVSVHGTDLGRMREVGHLAELVRRHAHAIDRALVLNRSDAAYVIDVAGVERSRVVMTVNGFDAEVFHPDMECGGRAAAFQTVLYVGKFDRRKGLEWVLRALPRVAGARLIVVGGAGDPAEDRRLQNIVDELGIRPRVTFTGALPPVEVAKLMNESDVLALPAFFEPFGLVVIEALACGTPVVVTDQGGPPEFIPAALFESGAAVKIPGLPREDAHDFEPLVGALADALNAMRRVTFDERLEISRAVQHLSWRGAVESLRAEYDDALK